MSTQLHITDSEVIGKHWAEVDISRLVARQLDRIRKDLADRGLSRAEIVRLIPPHLQSQDPIPELPERLLMLNACGFTVDPFTGEVSAYE